MILSLVNHEPLEYSPVYIPEHGLLAAVLERSVRDLGVHVSTVERREAIEWFLGSEKDLEEAITYQFVKEELRLSKSDCDLIASMVHQAEELQKQELVKRRKELGIKLAPVPALSSRSCECSKCISTSSESTQD